MKRLKTFFTLVLVVIASVSFAQSKVLSKANKFYKNKEYAAAIPLYEKSLEEKQSVSVQTKLAYCYKSVNQIDKAEKLYSDIVYADKPKPITFFYYGESLMRNGKYAAAKFWFEEYLKKKPNDPQSLRMIESCDKVNLIKPYFGNYVDVLPFSMNSESDDNAPVMLDDQMVFCSDRKQKIKLLKQKSGVTGRDFISLYQSQKQADGSFTEPTSFSAKINGLNKNTGPISFDGSGTTAIFSRNGDVANKAGAYTLQLYSAVREGTKWKNVELINFCKPSFNYMHPAISPDGQLLFFISDRAGGAGGTEIYQSEKKADGTWTKPVNLGDIVNTSGHEGFPFYDTEGRLFFSSKGHIGFGGYDVFFTTLDDLGNWTKPVNVGFPINSSSDDISIYVDKGGESGMFTSGRSGTSDDIFLFQKGSDTEEPMASPVSVSTPAPVETKPVVETVAEVVKQPEIIKEEVVVEPVISRPEVEVEEPLLTDIIAEQAEVPVVENAIPETITSNEMPEPVEMEIPRVEVAEPIAVEETLPKAEVQNTTEKSIAKVKKKKNKKQKKAKKIKEAKEVIVAEVEVAEPAQKVEEGVEVTAVVEVEEIVAEAPVTMEVEKEESLTEMIAEMSRTPSVETEAPVEIELEAPTEIIASELNTESIAVDETPKGGSDIMEPARLNTNPEMIEETLVIEKTDMATAVTLAPGSALAEFDGDLSSNNISNDRPYKIPSVDYDFNGTEINQNLMLALDQLAMILNTHPTVEIQLEGHTASFGNSNKNQQLSEKRAQLAAGYLMEKGIASHRITPKGFGETKLLNECVDGILCSMDQHKVNERLEVKVVRH